MADIFIGVMRNVKRFYSMAHVNFLAALKWAEFDILISPCTSALRYWLKHVKNMLAMNGSLPLSKEPSVSTIGRHVKYGICAVLSKFFQYWYVNFTAITRKRVITIIKKCYGVDIVFAKKQIDMSLHMKCRYFAFAHLHYNAWFCITVTR